MIFSDFNETLSGESHNQMPIYEKDFIIGDSDSLVEIPKKYNILVADDDAFGSMALTSMITKTKILDSDQVNIEIAVNGKSALEFFKERNLSASMQQPLNLIIMDCQMPIMDGFLASQKIKELVAHGTHDDVRIVGLTSFMGNDQINRARSSGMQEILQKPANQGVVDKLLFDYLSHL
jgi:two-component system, sensor histidine kinase and response regulator